VLRPIATLLPQNILHENIVAVALLLIICFSAGLLRRVALSRRIGRWFEMKFLEYIPGYSLLRSVTRRLTGQAEDQTFQAALVVIEDALVPAFIVEAHADGQYTVNAMQLRSRRRGRGSLNTSCVIELSDRKWTRTTISRQTTKHQR
jgi:hypothetical protein